MSKLVIFVVGPPKAGKTLISNHLAGVQNSLSKEYHPTRGVRILEFDKKLEITKKNKVKQLNVSVELWDCSGDLKYESCWSALSSSASGVIYVKDPGQTQQKDLEMWSRHFSFLKEDQALILANLQGDGRAKSKLSSDLPNVKVCGANMQDPQTYLSDFDNFLNCALEAYVKNREHEENRLMGITGK